MLMRGWNAYGPNFQRMLARLSRLMPEVEGALDKAEPAARPHVPAAGSGIDWGTSQRANAGWSAARTTGSP